jgi:hypothetical protein
MFLAEAMSLVAAGERAQAGRGGGAEDSFAPPPVPRLRRDPAPQAAPEPLAWAAE